MNSGKAFFAGVVGGVVMTILLTIGRWMGMDVNLSMMLGTMLGLLPGPGTWLVGFVMHLAISGLIALVYAWGFEHVTHRAGPAIGAEFGIVHFIFAGLVMGMVPLLHPMIPERMPAPGPFMAARGPMYVAAFAALHLIYGAIVGAMYGGVRTVGVEPGSTVRV